MKNTRFIRYAIILIAIPVCIALGTFVFDSKAYLWISLCVTLLACAPFFISFENKKADTRLTVILAVMTTLSVLGRFAFAAVQHFKPVAAIVIITGIYLGAESGFLCGALSAVLSNILFGQGPWTPFQMFAWGFVGFAAALCGKALRKSKILLCACGALSGIFFSLFMDIQTVLLWDEGFSFSRYIAAIAASLPVMAVYAASNVIFLLLLSKPIGEKLSRVINKYGIGK